METIVLALIILVCFNFVLKQTYRKAWMVGVITIVCALFVVFTWRFAIEQSKSQLQDWLGNQQLMLDVAVILSIEVIIQISYCIMSAHLMNTGKVRKRTLMVYRLLRWFPGMLIFPVLFHIETMCMFWLTGIDFATIAYGLAGVIAVLIPLLTWSFKWLIPEKELRLEIFFLTNVLIALLGIIATVNGRTAVAGVSEINIDSLVGFATLLVVGALGGFYYYRIKQNRLKI
ncbi:MAG: hypothetical protein K5874_04160 [Bacteroidaceae bacterium]|nr:hypothetical protein [Bacteroidaceae bacterium]